MAIRHRYGPKLMKALEDTGLPYDLVRGGRHIQVRVSGKLAGVLPLSGDNERSSRATMNVISNIRRVSRQIKEAGDAGYNGGKWGIQGMGGGRDRSKV